MSDPGLLSVALVSTQHGWHGGEEQARLLALGLRRRGHRCVLVARQDGAFCHRMACEGFDVTQLPGTGRNPLALWRIRRCLGRIRPDVLHLNDAHALLAGGMASVGLPIPARVASRRLDFPVRLSLHYRFLCDRVVCVSRAVARVCAEGGIPARMLRVVHDGVDAARIASGDRWRGRQALGVSDTEIVLLCVAKLTDHKGHRFLLDAMPPVLAQYPEARLFLAGDGELVETLRVQAVRLGIDKSICFLGFRHDVADLIRAADLFVFPSHMEGFGSTLVEAMLAGVPIVATTAGGIPDVTGKDEPGQGPVAWTVPPRDPQALARAMIGALQSPGRCAELGERARRRAESLFTADRMVERTLAVYREVLVSRGRSSGGRRSSGL